MKRITRVLPYGLIIVGLLGVFHGTMPYACEYHDPATHVFIWPWEGCVGTLPDVLSLSTPQSITLIALGIAWIAMRKWDGLSMNGLAVAIVVAGLAVAAGLYAGLHEIAEDLQSGSLHLDGDVTLNGGTGTFDVNVNQ